MNIPMTAVVINRSFHREFTYQSQLMLTLDVSFPEILLRNRLPAQIRINQYYRKISDDFYYYATDELLSSARKEYHDSIQNDFPFRPFDAVMNYAVTYNQNCLLSTYFDQYEFTGGAHGNTLRFSNTRDLNWGNTVLMGSLFPQGTDYRRLVLDQIQMLADKQMAENPYVYFDNYKELIVKYFNQNSFYLTPVGLCVYYQQYEIGPYASGIIVFEMPYETLAIQQPSCTRLTAVNQKAL